MEIFKPLRNRLDDWMQNQNSNLTLTGVSPEQWGFINFLCKEQNDKFLQNDQLVVFSTNDKAENFYHQIKDAFNQEMNFIHFPGMDASPYSGLIASERNLIFRLRILDLLRQKIGHRKKSFIVTSIEALGLKIPPHSFFEDHSFSLEESDIISPDELAGKLVGLGYTSSHTVEESGTFCKKGEIFDIFPISHRPIRIHYFDDMIEEIYLIDKHTQKTIKEQKIAKLSISPAPGIFTRSEFSQNLRDNIAKANPSQKLKFERRKNIFQSLSDGMLFDNYPAYTSLFFKESETLLDYLDNPLITVIDDNDVEEFFVSYTEELRSDYEDVQSPDEESLLPEPSKLYDLNIYPHLHEVFCLKINDVTIQTNLNEEGQTLDIHLENARQFFSKFINLATPKHELIKNVINLIKDEFKYSGHIIFTVQNDNSKNEILHILETLEVKNEILERISFIKYKLASGFYYGNEKTLIISDADIFSVKTNKAKVEKSADYDLFAEQLASLKKGDYVVHSTHGVGLYQGLEAMDVGGSKSDFLVLEFKGKDKVFVPIYKMNLIQKFADSTAKVSVDSLRTNKFSNTKARARESAKKLAFDLLKLQAERQSTEAFAFTPPEHEFHEFELDFPFNETPDQKSAIDSVIHSMQKNAPMDFLVCGDVGFGKTEVAMRAAFKAVLDGKQVAVLSPTTVLTLQHFNSFVKRFKNFPVNIDFLSRFKTGKDEKKTKAKIENGEIDIIIGTHKLLSSTVKFKDLGLVIVDEEQRFGVGHKNKLKLLKSTVDFLTLTATPIPRTLQLSFLGLKELALIKTAPPRRQSIKTYLIKEDDHTIQNAIQRELKRGGQVFIVHNRVNDMENYVAHIRELVPEAKIIFAHGQLPEKELEARVSAFYRGAYQILVSTTIIESGIDIPNANTMIVDRADMYGLSQLHQLRGRIGRSDKKAYCYFVIPKNRPINEIAQKRLKALQTYADMGSGFQIANCDLEIRGAGDILGAEQSGHIEAVGLELYMELLTEAIQELRGERRIIKKDIEINTPFASFIPNNYINDSSERLKIYKQLSNIQNVSDIQLQKERFFDIYGPLPKELENLLDILESRINLIHCAMKSVQVIDNKILLNFEKSLLDINEEIRNKIIDSFINRTRKYQFTPDFKLIYTHKESVTPSFLVEYTREIAEQIVPPTNNI